MPTYKYIARTVTGERLDGTMDAPSVDAVASQLVNNNTTPVEIYDAGEKDSLLTRIDKRLIGLPKANDLILLCRQLHTLLKAGVPIDRCFSGLSASAENPMLKEALIDISLQMESGRELSASFNRYPDMFPSLFVSMVHVGENTGKLDDVFATLARQLELERVTRAQIKSALRYPTFVMIAIFLAMGVLLVFVVPSFAKFFEHHGAELPMMTQIILGVSHFVTTYWLHLIIVFVAFILGLRKYGRSEEGRLHWDRIKLKLPLVGHILYRATLSRFSHTFAMCLSAGVPIVVALNLVAKAVDNIHVEKNILAMREGLERGESLFQTASRTEMFSPLVLQMISVGEEAGAVDTMLKEVGIFYDREVSYDIKKLSASIEPILTLFIGGIVLVLALGIFMPMWSISSAMKG
jgi:MSHA biogenesis protein MshG